MESQWCSEPWDLASLTLKGHDQTRALLSRAGNASGQRMECTGEYCRQSQDAMVSCCQWACYRLQVEQSRFCVGQGHVQNPSTSGWAMTIVDALILKT